MEKTPKSCHCEDSERSEGDEANHYIKFFNERSIHPGFIF